MKEKHYAVTPDGESFKIHPDIHPKMYANWYQFYRLVAKKPGFLSMIQTRDIAYTVTIKSWKK